MWLCLSSSEVRLRRRLLIMSTRHIRRALSPFRHHFRQVHDSIYRSTTHLRILASQLIYELSILYPTCSPPTMHQRTYTYVLAPRWDFRPDGPIALGKIIVDPFRPHRVLTRPDPDIPTAPIETVVETDWSLHHQRENGVKSSIWTHFLNAMGVDLGFEGSRSLDADYTVDSLTTSYFRDEPSHEEIIRRTQDGKIRDLMRLDSVFSKPVYRSRASRLRRDFVYLKAIPAPRKQMPGVKPVHRERLLAMSVLARTIRSIRRNQTNIRGRAKMILCSPSSL